MHLKVKAAKRPLEVEEATDAAPAGERKSLPTASSGAIIKVLMIKGLSYIYNVIHQDRHHNSNDFSSYQVLSISQAFLCSHSLHVKKKFDRVFSLLEDSHPPLKV